LLTKDYFENLVPEVKNNYIKYNTYDTMEPKISQVYDNSIVISEKMTSTSTSIPTTKLEHEIEPEIEPEIERKKCLPVDSHISSKIWKDSFPSNFKELYYEELNCGFYLLSDIIFKFTGNNLKLNEIKSELLEEYNKYLEKYGDQIIDILILEGKKTNGLRVKQKILSFQNFIYLEDYYITNFDIWIMMTKYKIPSIIISSKPIILTKKDKNVITLYGDISNKFVFIFSPAMRAETIPKYSIIVSMPERSMQHDLNVITNETKLREVTESVENVMNIESFLQSFSKKSLPKKAVKKPVKLVFQLENQTEIPDDKPVETLVVPTVAKTKKQKTTIVVTKPKQRTKRKIKFDVEE
jgi:hypothetical protein